MGRKREMGKRGDGFRWAILQCYHLMWSFALVACSPLYLLTKNGRFRERLGLNLPRVSLGKKTFWIHALSVGEVISAIPLVEALTVKFPQRPIVFTATTAKGMEIAQRELQGKVKALLTMPVDSWWSVRRIVKHVDPAVFVLVETDIWPALLDYLEKKGTPCLLVNGRISPSTFKSYQRFPFLVRQVFAPLESCLMQSDLDRERLLRVGIGPEKVRTVGNIKFDRDFLPMTEEECRKWLDLFGLPSDTIIWVAGSIHKGEEKILLEVFQRLSSEFTKLRLILAPRKTEESGTIWKLSREMGFKTTLRSELTRNSRFGEVLVLDTLGELNRVYGLGRLSFVGGSLVPTGGHNLLEPAGFGCPVFFGPHTFNFVEMGELLVAAGGGRQIRDGEELYRSIRALLEQDELRIRMGKRAKEFVEQNRGAVDRIVSYVEAAVSM
jgi:3-deoxy-D-manno-octulosonic-acid transferase